MHVIKLPAGKGDKVKLCGKLDRHFSSRLRAVLRVKAKEQHPVLILDCSESESIDSFGAATLIEYAQEAKKFGGRLALVGLRPGLKKFFRAIHMSEHLPLYDSFQEALSAS